MLTCAATMAGLQMQMFIFITSILTREMWSRRPSRGPTRLLRCSRFEALSCFFTCSQYWKPQRHLQTATIDSWSLCTPRIYRLRLYMLAASAAVSDRSRSQPARPAPTAQQPAALSSVCHLFNYLPHNKASLILCPQITCLFADKCFPHAARKTTNRFQIMYKGD